MRTLPVFFLAVSAWAQATDTVQRLLPSGAKIIETARLTVSGRTPRVMALWMVHPKRVVRQGDVYCGDYVYGDYWEGSTRLSLIDPEQHRLINTIEITGSEDDPFRIPFFVPKGYYFVGHPNDDGEGKPKILNLRDLTGERSPGQFVLFEYQACGIASTGIFGYTPYTDRVKQFQVETREGQHRPYLSMWVPYVFGREPIRPGYWNFTWEAGHGEGFVNHEEIAFDSTRQLFVRQLNRIPYAGVGEASCELETKKVTALLISLRSLFEAGLSDSEIEQLQRLVDDQEPSGNVVLSLPLHTKSDVDLYMYSRKYSDGTLGLWVETTPEMATRIQAKMDEALR